MAWDPVWEKIYRSRDWGRYPPEALVRFMARHYYSVAQRSSIRVLDVGCGPGSGASWFVAREGYALSGIDGSPTAIAKARERFSSEGIAGDFQTGAIDRLPWPDGCFDVVIDNGCLTCNSEHDAVASVNEIHRVLKAQGRHFSITPRAGCWGDGTGERVDATTWRNVTEGPFAGLGSTRFATAASLQRLYAGFRELEIEYSVRSEHAQEREVSHWIVTCRK